MTTPPVKQDAFALLMSRARSPPKRKREDEEETKNKKLKLEEEEEDSTDIIPLEEQKKIINSKITLPIESFETDEDVANYYQNVLAPFLLQEVELVVNGKIFYLREIEFYFTCELHNDPFTHCSEIQGKGGLWYFHRTGNSYRGGTYKGLDISIGIEGIGKGGILIRSVELASSKKVSCGPCVSVDLILSTCKASSIEDLVSNMKDDIEIFGGESGILKLQLSKTKRNDPVYHSARVGIHMTKRGVKKDLQERYVYVPYRSFTSPGKIFKGKNLMIIELYGQGVKADKISSITGANVSLVNSCITSFKEGEKRGKTDLYFGKRLSDAEVCACYGALFAMKKAKENIIKIEIKDEEVESGENQDNNADNNTNNSNDQNKGEDEEVVIVTTEEVIEEIKIGVNEDEDSAYDENEDDNDV